MRVRLAFCLEKTLIHFRISHLICADCDRRFEVVEQPKEVSVVPPGVWFFLQYMALFPAPSVPGVPVTHHRAGPLNGLNPPRFGRYHKLFMSAYSQTILCQHLSVLLLLILVSSGRNSLTGGRGVLKADSVPKYINLPYSIASMKFTPKSKQNRLRYSS